MICKQQKHQQVWLYFLFTWEFENFKIVSLKIKIYFCIYFFYFKIGYNSTWNLISVGVVYLNDAKHFIFLSLSVVVHCVYEDNNKIEIKSKIGEKSHKITRTHHCSIWHVLYQVQFQICIFLYFNWKKKLFNFKWPRTQCLDFILENNKGKNTSLKCRNNYNKEETSLIFNLVLVRLTFERCEKLFFFFKFP